jgi:hypothetical protein
MSSAEVARDPTQAVHEGVDHLLHGLRIFLDGGGRRVDHAAGYGPPYTAFVAVGGARCRRRPSRALAFHHGHHRIGADDGIDLGAARRATAVDVVPVPMNEASSALRPLRTIIYAAMKCVLEPGEVTPIFSP